MQLSPTATCGLMLPSVTPELSLDYLWAALCILGAAYFIFRG